jgi:hypothetical protein|tara:strand:+ start:243 stop:653 length:411 start_codon:yes stop_codon:yes gene_type:complete
MVMRDWFKKITGIAAKEVALAAEKTAIKEQEMALLKKKDPKAYATKKGEPWVNVLDMKVNDDNIRNGFFELDWNDLFIEELIRNGYGEEADPQEEIVDRWFRDIIYNMLEENGQDTTRGAGYINVVPISKGKSEVS